MDTPIPDERATQDDACSAEEALVELYRERGRPTLLRVSAPWCVRCEPFRDTVHAIAASHDLRLIHHELGDEDDNKEVVEKFLITQLPAYVLFTPTTDESTVRQGVTALSEIENDVQRVCGVERALVLDADF
jgi:thiol:disulfide interchange protein